MVELAPLKAVPEAPLWKFPVMYALSKTSEVIHAAWSSLELPEVSIQPNDPAVSYLAIKISFPPLEVMEVVLAQVKLLEKLPLTYTILLVPEMATLNP